MDYMRIINGLELRVAQKERQLREAVRLLNKVSVYRFRPENRLENSIEHFLTEHADIVKEVSQDK